MTADKWLALGAALVGAVGTGLLYRGSFALVQLGGFYASDEMLKQVAWGNRRRQRLQRAGLALLMVSFGLQALAVFLA